MSGGHSHGGGSSGAHSHDGGSGGTNPLIAVPIFILAAAFVYGMLGTANLGKYVYNYIHNGSGHAMSGSWGSMYLNIGWAVVWAAVALLIFLGLAAIPPMRKNAHIVVWMGLAAAAAALFLAGVTAPYFGNKVGVSVWSAASRSAGTGSDSAGPKSADPNGIHTSPRSFPIRYPQDMTLACANQYGKPSRARHLVGLTPPSYSVQCFRDGSQQGGLNLTVWCPVEAKLHHFRSPTGWRAYNRYRYSTVTSAVKPWRTWYCHRR